MSKAIRILVYKGNAAWLKRTLEQSITLGESLRASSWKISELFRRTYDEGEEPEAIKMVLKPFLKSPKSVIISISEEGGELESDST